MKISSHSSCHPPFYGWFFTWSDDGFDLWWYRKSDRSSAVFGLEKVGAAAAIPMLEGVSVFFKSFAGIDAIPLAINAKTSDEFVEIARVLAPTIGGICLEDEADGKLRPEIRDQGVSFNL